MHLDNLSPSDSYPRPVQDGFVAHHQVAIRPTPTIAVPFVMKASKTHVEVTATDKALGMRELMQVMQKDENLSKCVIESCSFDGSLFAAKLRIAA